MQPEGSSYYREIAKDNLLKITANKIFASGTLALACMRDEQKDKL